MRERALSCQRMSDAVSSRVGHMHTNALLTAPSCGGLAPWLCCLAGIPQRASSKTRPHRCGRERVCGIRAMDELEALSAPFERVCRFRVLGELEALIAQMPPRAGMKCHCAG